MPMPQAPSASATLQFLGAAGTVTGSKFLLQVGRRRLLMDAGLFQGLKELRLRNWEAPPFTPSALEAVTLSHAHIDHSGFLPRLARTGFRGKIYCTSGTADLLKVMLPDAAMLQEEDAERANRKGYTKHRPALPLYTGEDAQEALKRLRPCPYGTPIRVMEGCSALFRRAAHILGAASVELQLESGGKEPFRLVYSGDLGRWNQPMLREPEFVPEADVLLLESTYGDRTHPADPSEELARVVREAAQRGGALLIPAFAVGRAQEVIWRLRQLQDRGRIPALPIYLDSPMAIDATDLFCRHPEDHSLDMKEMMDKKQCPLCCRTQRLARTPEESKAINRVQGPAILISSSGMATGGRILHHLEKRLPDPRTTVLLVGFQAAGTRGRLLKEGAKMLRMHGQNIPVRAHVETIDGLSAHADQADILRWLSGFRRPPRRTFVVHGEPGQAEGLARAVADRLKWSVRPAVGGETVDLGALSA